MSKEDIKKFIKSQTIEVKVDPKTGIAKGTLFQKPKIVPSNNPTIKVGQTLSGKIDFKNSNTGNQIVKPGQEITGKVKK